MISYSFLVNCELPPAFKKHIFLSCEIEHIPTLFQEMSLSSHSNSLHPGHPLSPELCFLIAPRQPCTLAVDLTFPREPITLSSTFNHPDKFRDLLSQSFLFSCGSAAEMEMEDFHLWGGKGKAGLILSPPILGVHSGECWEPALPEDVSAPLNSSQLLPLGKCHPESGPGGPGSQRSTIQTHSTAKGLETGESEG